MAKHAIAGLTKTIALEVATSGVTINCVSPGYVWTPLVENQIPDTMKTRNMTREQVINDVLLDRAADQGVRPARAGRRAGAFLCRDEAAQITGANYSIDGGWTAAWRKGRRRMKGILPAALIALELTGCSVYREATATRPPAGWSWRKVMTEDDADRIRNWRRGLGRRALAPAKAAAPAAIAADADLFDPDRALGAAMPPAGEYRCRTFKLGSQQPLTPYFAAYPAGRCRITVEGPETHFVRLDGEQRPDGLIYTNTDARPMFIGVMVLGDETAPCATASIRRAT